MPIYEYYCTPCNTIFNFYATTFSIDRQPSCPRCGGELHKQVSAFSLGSRMKGPGSLPLSPQRLEEGMRRLDDFGRQDPQEAARLRKRFSEMTGANFEEDRQRPPSAARDSSEPRGPDKAAGEALPDEYGILPERDPHLYEL
jgi:putative FmdB family regulatory protein